MISNDKPDEDSKQEQSSVQDDAYEYKIGAADVSKGSLEEEVVEIDEDEDQLEARHRARASRSRPQLAIGGYRVGTTVLVLSSLCYVMLHIPVLVVLLAIYGLIIRAFEGGNINESIVLECSNTPRDVLRYYTIVASIVYISCLLVHATMLVNVAVSRGQGAAPSLLRISEVWLPLSGYVLILAEALVVICGTVFAAIFSSCISANAQLQVVVITLLVVGWITVIFGACCTYLSIEDPSQTSSLNWERRCRTLLCHCCWSGPDRDVDSEQVAFRTLAGNIDRMLEDVKGLGASDLVSGMMLVRSMQLMRKRQGHVYWWPHLDQNLQRCRRQPKNHPVIESLLKREQPELRQEDWAHLREIQYFRKYFLGSYGSPLYAMMRPWSVCRLCYCFMPQKERVIGRAWCYCSVKAFLIRANIRHHRLLHVSLVSQASTTVFYVCVDDEKETIIVAIRGTLSLQDALTDIDTEPAELSEIGLHGRYAHKGVFRAAMSLEKKLCECAALTDFITQNPSYTLTLLGHSLGAAVASLLTIIILHRPKHFPIVHCYAYAPPPTVDEATADDPRINEAITCVVMGNDLVPRLSVVSIARVKFQIKRLLAITENSSTLQLVNSRARIGAQKALERISKMSAAKVNYFHRRVEQEVIEWMETKGAHLKQFYIPGLVYHIVLPTRNAWWKIRWKASQTFAYPVNRRLFTEIIASKAMWLEHFPNAYARALSRLVVPKRSEVQEPPQDEAEVNANV